MRASVPVELGRRLLAWWDVRGRATRTELLGFSLFLGFFGLLLAVPPMLLDFPVEAQTWVDRAASLVVPLLWIPLCIRRLHDSGRSGVVLLVAAPPLLFDLQEKLHGFAYRWQPVHRPVWLQVVLGTFTLAFLVLLLWRGDEGPNRFGRNPRSGESDGAQLE